MDKTAKGLVEQIISGLEELPDTFSVRKLANTKYKIHIYEPSMVAEGADGEGDVEMDDDTESEEKPQDYILELKITKVK